MFMLALFATMYSVQNVNDINLNVVISIFEKLTILCVLIWAICRITIRQIAQLLFYVHRGGFRLFLGMSVRKSTQSESPVHTPWPGTGTESVHGVWCGVPWYFLNRGRKQCSLSLAFRIGALLGNLSVTFAEPLSSKSAPDIYLIV